MKDAMFDNNLKYTIFLLNIIFAVTNSKAAVDSNFHIYLCIGQSNMVGSAKWEASDNEYVDSRFMMLSTSNFESPCRKLGEWYTSYCPIVCQEGGLGPIDYFGRTMVAALPADFKVGVVPVAISGSPIEVFDKDKCDSIFKEKPTEYYTKASYYYYGGNPYAHLIEMARKAQEVGVIKGILLHQGCANCGDPNWCYSVKKIYNDIVLDLNLSPLDVPLFVGELGYEDMGGFCYKHNDIISKIPQIIPTGYVVRANGLPVNGLDHVHFLADGHRILGKRYAFEVLKAMGFETKMAAGYIMPDNLRKFFTPISYIDNILISAGDEFELKLMCTFEDNHQDVIEDDVLYYSSDFVVTEGKVKIEKAGMRGIVMAVYTDFFGNRHEVPITLVSSEIDYTNISSGNYSKIQNGNDSVYNINGLLYKSNVPSGILIRGRRKYVYTRHSR